MDILLTTFLTILTFVVGQIIDRLFIQPIQQQKIIIGEIHYSLFYYANYYIVDEKFGKMDQIYLDKLENAKDEIRKLGSRLLASTEVIPFYDFFARFKVVLNKSLVDEAYTGHIGWSNSIMDSTDKSAKWVFRKRIAGALNIKLIS